MMREYKGETIDEIMKEFKEFVAECESADRMQHKAAEFLDMCFAATLNSSRRV